MQENKKKLNEMYKNQFNRDRYDRLSLMLPKDFKERWSTYAKEEHQSMNSFIIQAVERYIVENHSNESDTSSNADDGSNQTSY